MPAAKRKSPSICATLIADRFNKSFNEKNKIQRSSITEFTSLSMLNEKLTIENKEISNSKYSVERVSEIEEKYSELIFSFDYDSTIPPRVPFNLVDKGDYKALESHVFNKWKFNRKNLIFERNIEIWRQLWIACENATVIAQIVDARDPLAYFNFDIMKTYPQKKHIILLNKSDLIFDADKVIQDLVAFNPIFSENVYAYSSKQGSFDFELEGTVALIGFPNVGKSSTINHILNQKKVKVSSTPGKTKYIQTIETPNFTLLDCPGLVFPGHSKIELLLMGVLNIEQVPDLCNYEDLILKIVGNDRIRQYFSLTKASDNILIDMCVQKGWQKSRCLKEIAKSYAMGEMPRF